MSKNHIAVVRDLVPQRPLLYEEALRYAELQADRLLELAKITHPAVPESVVTNLPRLEVRRYTPFPTSGASHFSEGKWLIAINGAEPETRQRFSLAHELKHIIDHAGSDLYFSNFPSQERAQMIERICDYFAGCLLMPRWWLTAAHNNGTDYVHDLAAMFGVSPSAMTVRLSQIGIAGPTRRCATSPDTWPYPRAMRQRPRSHTKVPQTIH